jgi:crotonobetainyl-CoA:carnitine CoA-transferase CaiB-like acyl-CoA transferase
LPGPYEHRTALDEVVQKMGGLANMTGRPGDPLRAGTSVNDIMGGMFGAIGVMGALIQRGITGRGQEVQSALFENNVFLVGQHMLQYAITGQAASPMPDRISAWAVYDVFTVKGGEQIFLAAVSDAQWKVFCEKLGFADLLAKTEYATNNDRVRLRSQLLPDLRTRLMHWSAKDLSDLFESAGLPYAPIAKPEDLFGDAHLQATGGLADVRLCDGPRAGQMARAALLPLSMNGQRLGVRQHPPIQGEHTDEVLAALGLSAQEVARLKSQGAVAGRVASVWSCITGPQVPWELGHGF